MKYLLLLLFPAICFGQKRRTDIIKPPAFYSGINQDFNKDYNLNPGDTVVLSGVYQYIGIENCHDLVFTNEGLVQAEEIKFLNKAVNVKLIGKPVNGQPGIQVGGNKARFALGWTAQGNLEISGVLAHDAPIGIQVLTKPSESNLYALNYQNLYIHDCIIQDIAFEGIYLGEYQTWVMPPALIKGRIENNIVRRTGNDGIQTRAGTFSILNNVIDSIGLGGAAWDAHGILIGGNTKGGIVKGNTVNAPGYGVFINGYGDFSITDNKLTSGISGIFTKNFGQEGGLNEDLQNVGYQKFDIQRNEINPGNGIAVQQYARTGPKVTSNIAGNITTGVLEIEPGVTLTKVATAQPAPTKTVLKSSYWVVEGKRKYYIIYTDFTWKWK